MKKFMAATLMAVSLSAGATSGALVPSSPASAEVVARRSPVNEAAYKVTVERVYGPLYGHYKAKYPKKLNWNNNGCSFPKPILEVRGVGKALRHYGAKFEKSCDRHDFGYRNHGRSGVSRKTVDRRFRDNMYYQCDRQHIDGLPPWLACRAAAKVIFEAVDTFGYRYW